MASTSNNNNDDDDDDDYNNTTMKMGSFARCWVFAPVQNNNKFERIREVTTGDPFVWRLFTFTPPFILSLLLLFFHSFTPSFILSLLLLFIHSFIALSITRSPSTTHSHLMNCPFHLLYPPILPSAHPSVRPFIFPFINVFKLTLFLKWHHYQTRLL